MVARCQHQHSRLVKVVAENTGAEMFTCQCVRCGGNATEWIPHRLVKHPEAVALRESKPPTTTELVAEERASLREMKREAYRLRRAFYDNYLLSPQWQTLRRMVFARCQTRCEHCGLARATQVHHKTYDRLGNEQLDDLLGVCGPCHERLHSAEEKEAMGE